MKTAKLHIAMIEFTCPWCEEHISSDNGSHLFTLDCIPEKLRCDCCGAELKVPGKVKKLK